MNRIATTILSGLIALHSRNYDQVESPLKSIRVGDERSHILETCGNPKRLGANDDEYCLIYDSREQNQASIKEIKFWFNMNEDLLLDRIEYN